MTDTNLDKKLETYHAPAPSDLLKNRILKAAIAKPSARPAYRTRFTAMAATLLAVCAIGFGTLQVTQTTKTETAAWQEAATDLGFDDIYDWVETEEVSTQ